MHIAHISADGSKQTCEAHCLNVAKIAKGKLNSIGLGNTAYLAGIMHDVGKFSNEFDEYISAANRGEKVKKGSIIHSFAGCSYILKKFHTDENLFGYKEITAEIIAYAIGAHHGLFDLESDKKDDGFTYRTTKQPSFDRRAIEDFFKECKEEKEIVNLFEKSLEEITSFINDLIDVFNINELPEDAYNDRVCFYTGMLARLVLSAVIDGDRTDTYRFMSGCDEELEVDSFDWEIYLKNAEKQMLSMECNTSIQKARKELSDICMNFAKNPTDIYKLKMPTGSGKTLAGLRYALHHAKLTGKKRIFYIAPLISILEQNAKVIKDVIGDSKIVLEHHSNVVIEDDKFDDTGNEHSELLSQTWDTPIVVTTLVQFLNTLFGGKTSQIRRFSSLTDSVIILDEVQSVPWKMLSMFNLAMNFLKIVCNTTVLLCSATQPTFDTLENKMFVSAVSFLSEKQEEYYSSVFKRSDICNAGNYRLEQLPEFIRDIMRNSVSTLVICNKKSESEYLYNSLKSDEYIIVHLSASMCMVHREKMLSKLIRALSNGEKILCVSTQVIEAGVDVSFENVIRFEAGLDNIVQAAGRCNRHGICNKSCKTYIVSCTDESLNHLKEIYMAKKATDELLYQYEIDSSRFGDDLSSSEAVKCYYDSLFKSISDIKNYCDYPVENHAYLTLLDILSNNDLWRKENYKYFMAQAFKTAGDIFEPIKSNTVSVIVPYDGGKEIISDLCSDKTKYDIKIAKTLISEAKKYTVSIVLSQAQMLLRQGGIYKVYNDSIYVLNEGYYSDETGLRMEKEGTQCSILIL